MPRPNPHYQNRAQYVSYYHQGKSFRTQTPLPPHQEFAPPQRSTRLPSQPVAQASMPSSTVSAPPSGTVYARREMVTAQPSPSRERGLLWRSRNFLLTGGGMLALAAIVIGPRPFLDRTATEESSSSNVVCEQTVQSSSVLSRAELSQLLSVAERAPKEDVRAVISEPYCTLPSVNVREGTVSEREAYPLEFNPQTWFIVLYEEGEYAGFDFSFYRE